MSDRRRYIETGEEVVEEKQTNRNEIGIRRYGKYRKERKEHSNKDVYKQRRDLYCDSDAADI
jgi:hypothetical protein